MGIDVKHENFEKTKVHFHGHQNEDNDHDKRLHTMQADSEKSSLYQNFKEPHI